MRKFEYPKLVIEEAKNLRKKATKEELDNLDLLNFIADSEFGCVYGQMTGSCFSQRATTLIKSCCSKVHKSGVYNLSKAAVNGSPETLSRNEFWSPIECFIWGKDSEDESVQNLFAYLRGEIKTL